MIRTLGARAHDFGQHTPQILSEKIFENELSSIQLALNKAIEGIHTIDQLIDDEMLESIKGAFDEKQIKIAVLGCYLNYAHPEKIKREENLEVFYKHIEYAKILGARVVGTETGSLNGDYSFNENNSSKEAYIKFARSLESMLMVAEENQVDIAIEGVATHIINNNKRVKQLVDDMRSDRLRLILDPVNLLTIDNYKNQSDVVKESFELYGDKIDIVHLKDFNVKDNCIIEINHFDGDYDYGSLMSLIKQSPNQIDILLENTSIEKVRKTKESLKRFL